MPERFANHWGPKDLESGSKATEFSSTTETNGTISLTSGAAAHGGYGIDFSFDGTGTELYAANAGAGDVSELFWRGFVYCRSGLNGDADGSLFFNFIYNASFTVVIPIYFLLDGDGDAVGIAAYDADGNVCYDLNHFSHDTWMRVEVHWVKHSTTGGVEGKINGADFDVNSMVNDTSAQVDMGDAYLHGCTDVGFVTNPDNGDGFYLDDIMVGEGNWVGDWWPLSRAAKKGH
jgi:hypothetical protein